MKNCFVLSSMLLALLLTASGCNTSSAPSVKNSGDKGFDQTAAYALSNVSMLKKRSNLNTPTKIVDYMFSTMGSAELTPPSAELEPDMAAHYTGPRPAKGIWVQSSAKDKNEFFKRHLVLTPDDSRNVIIAEAYQENADDPFYTWEWSLK